MKSKKQIRGEQAMYRAGLKLRHSIQRKRIAKAEQAALKAAEKFHARTLVVADLLNTPLAHFGMDPAERALHRAVERLQRAREKPK